MNNHTGFRSRRALAAPVCGVLGFSALGLIPAHAQTEFNYGRHAAWLDRDPLVSVATKLLASDKCIPANKIWIIRDLERMAIGDEKEAMLFAHFAEEETAAADRAATDAAANGINPGDFIEHTRNQARVYADLANEVRFSARELRSLIVRLKSLPPCPPKIVPGAGIAGGTALHIASPPQPASAADIARDLDRGIAATYPEEGLVGVTAQLGSSIDRITITSPTDKDKFKFNSPTFQIGGQFIYGPWFGNGQVTVPMFPNGTLTEGFGGASSSTADINSGYLANVQAIAGYYVHQTPSTRIGVFGQFYASSESLSGAFPGSRMEAPLLSDRWLAGGGGVKFDQGFWLGGIPVTFNASVAGLFDGVQSGLFHGGGGGVQAITGFSLPVGPGQFGVSAQYTDLTASGSSLGVPLRQTEQDLLLSVSYRLQKGIIP